MITLKTLDIITLAMQEIGALDPNETPSSEDANFCLQKLNLRIDEWAARKVYAFAMEFGLYDLIPFKAPALIGPSGDYVVATRPTRLESAAIVLNTTTPSTDIPMNVRDDQWWATNQVKSINSSTPTDVYYDPTMPNGSLYFWPVPNFAYQVRLEFWIVVTQVQNLTTVLQLPQGYSNALMLQLAFDICGAFSRPFTPEQRENLRNAIKAVQANNDGSPRIMTREAGQSAQGPCKPDFNYLSGTPWTGN